MRRVLATFCLFPLCLLVLSGCDEATGPLAEKPAHILEHAAGISDAVSDAEAIDLLADSTDGSSADVRNLSVQLDAILPVLARRSGVLRLWVLKDSIESTTIVSSVSFPRSQSTNTHVQDRERTAAVAAAREQLLRAFEAAAAETPRRSPLFGAVTRIGMTTSPYRTRTVLLVSDLKVEEPGVASWECGPIDVDRVLPNSLRGISIVAAFFDIAPAPKCHDTVARHLQLREAFQQLATRSGARITFTTGPYGGDE
jgi:hypothetical protein